MADRIFTTTQPRFVVDATNAATNRKIRLIGKITRMTFGLSGQEVAVYLMHDEATQRVYMLTEEEQATATLYHPEYSATND